MTNILTMLSGSHVVQGIIVGGVLAFLTANIVMNAVVKAMTTTVNGWSTTFKCGQPGNGILLRAACAKVLPAVNVAQEAAYWTTSTTCRQSCKCTDMNRFILKYKYPITFAILAVLAWVIYRYFSMGGSQLITFVVVAVLVWGLGTFVFLYFWPPITYSAYKRAV